MKTKPHTILVTFFLFSIPILNFGQVPVLGTVSDFVLFTSAGAVGNTGTSFISGGAIGTNTNSGTITGFDAVNCVKHIDDEATAQCALDLQAAFDEIDAITPTEEITAESLSNGTFTAGVYHINSAAVVSINLTLNAENNPDALFIFKVTGAFSLAANVEIILINGATVNNVFWNVDGAVDAGTGAYLRGTFFSLAGAISLGNGASLQGRALTIAGAVTIYNSNVWSGELTWNGSTDSDWHTATNWTSETVPTASYNVTIPASLTNYPTLSTAGACNNLTIESASGSTGSLTGQSNLTVNGTVIIQCYVTGVDKWHLISSPVGGQNIEAFVVTDVATNAVATNGGTHYGLAPFDNTTINWTNYTTAAGTNNIASAGDFVAGKGYEVMRTSNGILSFTGTVVTADVNIGITKSTSGWNLVGNPFPSAINAANVETNFLTVNAAPINDLYEAIYIWDADAETPDYFTINQTSGATYIAPGQAFFVYSVDGGSSVNFTEAMQTNQTGYIFKGREIEYPSIKLIAECSKGTTSTNIKYIENTTAGFDPGYDAGRFSGRDNSFAVCTHLVGDETNLVDLDIQCLPANDYNLIIPVGLNALENTQVIFRAQATNLPADVPVYLEDIVTGTITALHELSSFYTVTLTTKSEGTGRFFLHTKSVATGIEPLTGNNNLTIIPRPQYNSIRVIGTIDNLAEIAVYDMTGRKLINHKLNTSSSINDVEMNALISGFYIVSISSPTQKVSKKISWVKN